LPPSGHKHGDPLAKLTGSKPEAIGLSALLPRFGGPKTLAPGDKDPESLMPKVKTPE